MYFAYCNESRFVDGVLFCWITKINLISYLHHSIEIALFSLIHKSLFICSTLLFIAYINVHQQLNIFNLKAHKTHSYIIPGSGAIYHAYTYIGLLITWQIHNQALQNPSMLFATLFRICLRNNVDVAIHSLIHTGPISQTWINFNSGID